MVTKLNTNFKANFTKVDTTTIVSPLLVAFLSVSPCLTINVTLTDSILTDTISTVACKGGGGLSVGGKLVVVVSILYFAVTNDCVTDVIPGAAVNGFSIFVALLLNVGFVIGPMARPGRHLLTTATGRGTVHSITYNTTINFVYNFINTNNKVVVLLILASILNCRLGATINADIFVVDTATLANSIDRFIVNKVPSIGTLIVYIIDALIFTRVTSLLTGGLPTGALGEVANTVLIILNVTILNIGCLT